MKKSNHIEVFVDSLYSGRQTINHQAIQVMKKLMLIIAIATMTVVANAQNKVTTAKTAPEMVYYYTSFNVVRMRETLCLRR